MTFKDMCMGIVTSSAIIVCSIVAQDIYKTSRQNIWRNAKTYSDCLCTFGSFENLPKEAKFADSAYWRPKDSCEAAQAWAIEHGFEKANIDYSTYPYYREILKRRRVENATP